MSGRKVSLSRYQTVILWDGTSALTKSAATFLNISWVSLSLKSIFFSYGLIFLRQERSPTLVQNVQIVQVGQNVTPVPKSSPSPAPFPGSVDPIRDGVRKLAGRYRVCRRHATVQAR